MTEPIITIIGGYKKKRWRISTDSPFSLKKTEEMEKEILKNLEQVFTRIKKACYNSKRDPKEIKVLLATKTISAEHIGIALHAGLTLIAENKVQELKEKHPLLVHIPHTNHFIGHLQSNKIKDLLKYDVSCLQSMDRLDLAQKLQKRLEYENKTMDVLIQVNTSGEQSKFGITPSQAIELVTHLSKLDRLKVKGLMTIGLFTTDKEKVRLCFQRLRHLQQQLMNSNIPGIEMKELSMGMSGDLEIAIEEGATILRIGTAVFGKRALPDSYYWNETTA